MLTRFVRIQLALFVIVSMVGMTAMLLAYIQVPTLLGIGRITVTLKLPAAGGLYRFSNVTYRGIEVGKVTAMDVNRQGATATLSLRASPKIPADSHVEVRSISAVGEQYVDLRPDDDRPPYLTDGAVLVAGADAVPQPVGPMLDKLSALVGSIPGDALNNLLDETYAGLNGEGYDLSTLIDSSSTITREMKDTADATAFLVDDSVPLLDSQRQTVEELKLWARSLSGVTEQLVTNDPQVRTLLQTGPGFAQEVSHLLNQVKPTLPVLLANLVTLGQVAVTYNAALEQLLVLFPPFLSYFQASTPAHNATGIPVGDFRISASDPPACTAGFLPPSSWRSPADTTTIDTPDGLYCKLPQNAPIAVRGARNYPCLGRPGKRAPTAQICYSDQPFVPLAERQHALGPYPLDPNLIAQGVPTDERVRLDDHIYGPLAGTPGPPPVNPPIEVPPAAVPPPAPGPPPAAVPPPSDVPPQPGPFAPSGFDSRATPGPSVAALHYDPRTGRYVTPDGKAAVQRNLVTPAPKSFADLMLTAIT